MAKDLCEFLVNLVRFATSDVAYQILYPGWFIPNTIITWFSSTRGLSSCLVLRWRIWHLIYWNLRKTGLREKVPEKTDEFLVVLCILKSLRSHCSFLRETRIHENLVLQKNVSIALIYFKKSFLWGRHKKSVPVSTWYSPRSVFIENLTLE